VTARGERILAWAIFAASWVGIAQQAWFEWQLRATPQREAWAGSNSALESVLFVVLISSFTLTGLVVALRRSSNPLGWLLLTIGAIFALGTTAYGRYSILVDPLPFGTWALAFDQWTWVPAVGLLGTFTLLLFPDGHLPSPRWRWLAWLTTATLVVSSMAILLSSTPIQVAEHVHVDNPFSIGALAPAVDPLQFAFLLIPICIVASAASLVVRFRRSGGVERQQVKWLAFAGGTVAVLYLFVMFVSLGYTNGGTQPVWLDALQIYTVYTFALIPIAIGVAVLRYRLWDIDLVISKTVVAGLLVAFITLVYVGIVVGLGTLIGNPNDATLSLAATALVALLFGPVRERVRRFANRLVYGKRATPYEVMAGFAHRVSGSVSIEDVLPEMAEVASRGVGARAARVRVALPGGDERIRTWPEDGSGIGDAYDRSLDVTYQGDVIGAVEVAMPANEPLRPDAERLLEDLAAQAGLALHNVRLTEELAIRARELAVQAEGLRVSRERLVTARDAQRRGLERDIREGPERQLREIRAQLDSVVVQAPDAESRLDALTIRANDTLEGLRDLARGIFPPLLADKGVVAALEAHIRKVGANAEVRATPAFMGQRFDADVEACLYFCALQAIQNVMRHAENTACAVDLDADDTTIRFALSDRGRGFDPASTRRGMGLDIMQDRIDALEGTLDVASAPGTGTTIAGAVPVRAKGRLVS
jgi:signal transduction histidine kinase